MYKALTTFLLLTLLAFDYSAGYSALEDARIIAAYKRQLRLNHARIARKLVQQANWAAVGTISSDEKVTSYPMVNVIATDDNNLKGDSTGKIHFLLTDLDFTGQDWKKNNKVTFLFSEEQNQNCSKRSTDPMEPTCARGIFTGKVKELDKESAYYKDAVAAFVKRHPVARNWLKAHSFYLCELDIENIYILDFYGGPHNVAVTDYYNTSPTEVD